MSKVFEMQPSTMVTFMNKKYEQEICEKERKEFKELTKEQKEKCRWPKWKKFGELNEKEKAEYNLAGYPKDCILFDKDFKETTQEEIEKDYLKFIDKLKAKGVKNYLSWRSPNGFHVLTAFKDFDKLSTDIKTEIKREYIEHFECDPAKISDRGVVSVPDRPHFKNMVTYPIREEVYEDKNPIKRQVLAKASEAVREKEEAMKNIKIDADQDFSDFFEKDPLFIHCRDNIVPEGTTRNNVLFPNLAIACAGSGKSKAEIDEIMEPIIRNNFPGKVYAEFEGWLKKAFAGELNDFNKTIINTWFQDHCNVAMAYDLKGVEVDVLAEMEKEIKERKVDKDFTKDNRINLIWNKDVLDLAVGETEWLIKDWIAKGDICMVIGKSNSYKSTCLMHMALAVANGALVFNKYETRKSKVLYVNEENHATIIRDIYNRIYNGLELESSEGFALAQEEALKLDVDKEGKISDLKALGDIINENKIEVLVLDTLRRFISFDENDATKMSGFYDRLKRLRNYCNGLTILVLHHSKKSSLKGSYDLRDEARGSSDIIQSADTAISIARRVGKTSFKILHIKCRSAIEQEAKVIIVGAGEDKNNYSSLYESEKASDIETVATKIEVSAEKILSFVEDSDTNVFKRKEISEALAEFYEDSIVYKSLKALEEEGVVNRQGKGKNTLWVFKEGAGKKEVKEEEDA